MKKTNITILISFCFICLSAQNTFFNKYNSNDFIIPYCSVESGNNNYVLAGGMFNNPIPNSVILKFDQQGNLLQKETYQSTNGSIFCILQNSIANPGEFLLIESLYTLPNNSFKIYQVNDDLQFNLIKEFHFTDSLHRIAQSIINLNDSIFFLLLSRTKEKLIDISLLKLNIFDNSSTLFEPDSLEMRFPSGLMYDTSNHRIKISHEITELKRSSWHYISTFDSDLNLLSSTNPHPDFSGDLRIEALDNSYYLATGAISKPFELSQKLNVFKLDIDTDEIVDSIQLNYGPDTITYPGAVKSMLVTDSCIWVVGMYNVIPSLFPWSSEPMWVQLTKLTKDFELISQHYYGGDGTYIPYSIIETSDHGILISGAYFNPYAVPIIYKNDPFIIKTNSDGIVVSTGDHDLPVAQEAIVFPNPGNDYMQVKVAAQINKADIQLFDTDGSLIISKNLDIDNAIISTEHLKPGAYLYRIFTGNRLIGSGKWIKTFPSGG